MAQPQSKVVVLGAGITGLTAAWELSTTYRDRVVLVEHASAVGGLASTVAKHTKVIEGIEPSLVLDGVRLIYERVTQRSS